MQANKQVNSTKIELKDVSYEYNKGTSFSKIALNNINITINPGEFVGLIGHTGSGKSTLIQHINGLISPTNGAVFLGEKNINADKQALKEARRTCGIVFQYPEHQLFETSVFKDVSFGPSNLGLSKEEVERRTGAALETMGISKDIYEKSPFELSGGQKRRVAIAGVLAIEPSVLILDEPTAGLDPKGRDELLETLISMHKTLNITIILVSHSMEDIAKIASRIIVMEKSEIIMDGTPKEVFKHHKRLEEVGLDAPQTTILFDRLIENGLSLSPDVFTVEQATEALFTLLKEAETNG